MIILYEVITRTHTSDALLFLADFGIIINNLCVAILYIQCSV